MRDSLAMVTKKKREKFYIILLSNKFQIFFIVLHMGYLLDENQKKSNMSYMFSFLRSTLDRKEEIMQFKNNIHLRLVDVA